MSGEDRGDLAVVDMIAWGVGNEAAIARKVCEDLQTEFRPLSHYQPNGRASFGFPSRRSRAMRFQRPLLLALNIMEYRYVHL